MSSLFYPAVFHPDDDSYWVSFPDIPEALTEGKDIEYPVEIINIQKKINDQLGLYRGARKLIGLLSILAIFFFMTIYADQRKVTNFWSNKR